MKNVAKCDTWCELQNPVNHRVFERKLRPKPSGRGHVCLGVTNRRPPILSRISDGSWSPVCYRTRLAKIRAKDARSVLTCGGEFNSRQIVSRFGPKALDDPKSSTRPQSGEASSATDRAQVPWKGAPERVRAPSCPDPVAPRGAVYESGCLGMQPQSGGKFRPRLNMGERPIANKYREGSGWGPAMRPGVVPHASGRMRCDTRASTCPDACFLYMPDDSTTSRWLAAWLECMRRDTPASACRFACADRRYCDTSSYDLSSCMFSHHARLDLLLLMTLIC
uniref:Uncharacterized protein n=1 Tax=Brassica oleracea var. oleracea TaxID=109376 RepID=A0A0D3AW20_BRAOL